MLDILAIATDAAGFPGIVILAAVAVSAVAASFLSKL
jgi:hypothetical protein